MLHMPLALSKGLKEWYADLPEHVRQAMYLSDHFNFSQKSCHRWDAVSSKCGATTEKLILNRDWEFEWVEHTFTINNFPISGRHDWMDRTEFDDELTVEFDDLQQADTEVILNKKSLADMGLWREMYSVPGKYADFIEYKCLTAITRNRKTEFHGCPFHSGYQLTKMVIDIWEKGETTTEEACRRIGPYFLRKSNWLPPVPDGMPWQDFHLRSFTAGVARHAQAMMRKRMPERKAWAIAWDSAKKEHPEYEEYISNITRFTREAIPFKNIKLDAKLKADAISGAKRFFKAQGMDIPTNEVLKTYDWMVCGSGAEKKPSLLAGCPLVTHVPEGKYAVRIILQTAVTDRLQEMYQVDPTKEHKGWVRFMDADMPATEFNKLSLDERKKLLGCECEHCVQRDIFLPIVDHKGKIVFRVASEVLLNEAAFDSIVGLLTELTELGVDAISYGEEDFLRENRRVIDYDFTDLKDDKPVQGEIDEYNWDESPTAETWEHINWDKLMARRDGLPDIHPAHEILPDRIYIDKSVIRKKGK